MLDDQTVKHGIQNPDFGVSSDSNDLSSASDKGVIVNNDYSIEGSEICQ